MKVVILAGGYGTRLSEETDIRPKPMVEIGGKPILWHIMKIYSKHGFNDFVILLGYKGYYIKEYFSNYFLHQSDLTIDLANNKMEVHSNKSEPWKISLIDTGINTMTGGRIKKAREFIGNEPFMLTYGDGVSNVNIKELLAFHNTNAGHITMTSIQPEGRFGRIGIEEETGLVEEFKEKPKGDGSWINGGFFVCNPEVFDYIEDETTIFEREPLEALSKDKKLFTYRHESFWKCMDTLKDKIDLNAMWEEDNAEWKIWN